MDNVNSIAFVSEYQMVHASNSTALAVTINKKISEGYMLYGHTIVNNDGLFQAMVKLDERYSKMIDKVLKDLELL